jgi:hypothetical protein
MQNLILPLYDPRPVHRIVFRLMFLTILNERKKMCEISLHVTISVLLERYINTICIII